MTRKNSQKAKRQKTNRGGKMAAYRDPKTPQFMGKKEQKEAQDGQ